MSKPRNFRLVVIRTGQTEWDRVGRLGGSADLPLCEAGESALRVTLDGFEAPEDGDVTVRVLSSEDEASVQTAAAVTESLGGTTKALEGLREVGLGLWEGSLRSELEERRPTAFRRWVDGPWNVTPPEGEPLDEAAGRLRAQVLRSLEKQKSAVGTVVLVVRPIAWSLIVAWLRGVSAASVAEIQAEDCPLSMHDVELSALKRLALRAPVGSGAA